MNFFGSELYCQTATKIKNHNNSKGTWEIYSYKDNLVKIISSTPTQVELLIKTGKSGEFTLSYVEDGEEIAYLDISIGSL